MALPPPQATTFKADLTAFEEEKKMPYVTSIERIAREDGIATGRVEGRTEGLLRGIEAVLELRFGTAGVALMPRVRTIPDPAVLERLLQEGKSVPDLAAFAALLPAQSPG